MLPDQLPLDDIGRHVPLHYRDAKTAGMIGNFRMA